MINTNRKPSLKPQSQISITSRKKTGDIVKTQSQNISNPQENRIKKLEEELAQAKRLLSKRNEEIIQKNKTIEDLKKKLRSFESSHTNRRSHQQNIPINSMNPQGKVP